MKDVGKDMPDARISTHMAHVGFYVSKPETARYYIDVLGFREFWRGTVDGKTASYSNLFAPEGSDYIEFILGAPPDTKERKGTVYHIALEVPNRIWQQSRYVRRSAEAIEGVKVSENFSADSPARVRDREPVENHISRTQRIRERNRIRMNRRNDIGARAQALSYAQTCQCDAQTEQHDRAADLDHHASTQILQPLSCQVNWLEFHSHI